MSADDSSSIKAALSFYSDFKDAKEFDAKCKQDSSAARNHHSAVLTLLRDGAEEFGEELYERGLWTIYRFGNAVLSMPIDAFFSSPLPGWPDYRTGNPRSCAVCLKVYDAIVNTDAIFAADATKETILEHARPSADFSLQAPRFLEQLAHAGPSPRSVAAYVIWAAARCETLRPCARDERAASAAADATEIVKLLREFAAKVMKMETFLTELPADYVFDDADATRKREPKVVLKEASMELNAAFSGYEPATCRKRFDKVKRAYGILVRRIAEPPAKKAKKE